MPFGRIRCHFCGVRQPHDKSITQFQCSNCEAINFLDGRGNIVDTPTTFTTQNAAPDKRPFAFARPLPESLDYQQSKAFCRTCTQNQLLYNETLANYLPDETHPQYQKFEAAIPAYKKELEKRYPLVCKKCAPLAQSMINRADSYGLTQNARRLQAVTRARGGMPATRTRDNLDKKAMRIVCNLITLGLYTGLAAQVLYHTYGIFNILFSAAAEPGQYQVLSDADLPTLMPSFRECAQQFTYLQFSPSCHEKLSSVIPFTVALSTCFLWYNPGIKAWYHHTNRIEAVLGQRNYFCMQAIILIVRTWAWYTLSNADATANLDKEQIIGLHGFIILFIFLAQAMANRSIQPVLWTLKGKIMPKPNDMDVLSVSAGPSPEHYTPKASHQDPWKYLRKPEGGTFDINVLEPKPPKPPSFTRTSYLTQQPSPEISEDEADYDAMETDDQPVMRSSQSFSRPTFQPQTQHHNPAPGIGFGSMTDEVFNMQTQIRQAEQQKRQAEEQKLRFEPPSRERSPFYGHLPPAPVSMERRLRNPVVTPIEPQRIPLSQQKDFMAQMRAGVKPVQFPEKGTNFELRQSDWHLPGDVRETGLEDRFLNTFNLAEPSPPGKENKRRFFGLLAR